MTSRKDPRSFGQEPFALEDHVVEIIQRMVSQPRVVISVKKRKIRRRKEDAVLRDPAGRLAAADQVLQDGGRKDGIGIKGVLAGRDIPVKLRKVSEAVGL